MTFTVKEHDSAIKHLQIQKCDSGRTRKAETPRCRAGCVLGSTGQMDGAPAPQAANTTDFVKRDGSQLKVYHPHHLASA